MIVNDEEALERLNSPDNLVNKLKIKQLHSNRIGPHVPPMIQTLAVALGEVDSRKAAGESFGMSGQNVSYLTNHGKKVNHDAVKETVSTVHNNALDAMLESIRLIKPKLANVSKATDLSQVAANLARVVEKTSPKEAVQTNLVVVAYAPRMKEEVEYEECIVTG